MNGKEYQHKELADGKWSTLSLEQQMGNIGSEVSRAIKWSEKNKKRADKAVGRALELVDISLVANKDSVPITKELTMAKNELVDYFLGDNEYNSKPDIILRYYNQFALINRRK